MQTPLVELQVSSAADSKSLIDQASLWLAQCRQVLLMISDQHAETIGDEIWGAITLLEMGKALVDVQLSTGDVSHA
jgi:hypothetical protein